MIMLKGDRDRKGIKRRIGIERDKDREEDKKGMGLSIPIPLWL
jgi:hypothetical protein